MQAKKQISTCENLQNQISTCENLQTQISIWKNLHNQISTCESLQKFYNLVLLETASRSWNITVFVLYLEFTVGKERKRREGEVLCSAKMPLKANLSRIVSFSSLQCQKISPDRCNNVSTWSKVWRRNTIWSCFGRETLFYFPFQPEFSREKMRPWDFPNLRVFPFLKVLFTNMFLYCMILDLFGFCAVL